MIHFRLSSLKLEPTATGEWNSLLSHIDQFRWSEVAAGPPHRPTRDRAWVLSLPNWVSPYFQERVSRLLFADPVQVGGAMAHRAEWATSLIIYPLDGNITIPVGILEGFSSGGITILCNKTKRGWNAFAELFFSDADAGIEENSLASLGWGIQPLPPWQHRLTQPSWAKPITPRFFSKPVGAILLGTVARSATTHHEAACVLAPPEPLQATTTNH